MREADQALLAIGFSDYEARAYLALLDQAPANGYQIAKLSGIPRAKIYECLERLVARGAAIQVEALDPEVRLFAPTDPDQLIANIEEGTNTACARARETLEQYKSDSRTVEVLWRVSSQKDLIARGRNLTDGAQKTLHVAIWAEEFEALLPHLEEAAKRRLQMALVLYSPHRGLARLQELGIGAILHSRTKRAAIPVMGRQFAVVADRERCITGSIFSEHEVEGVFTLNRGLVTNVVDLVNHEIYLERIMQKVGKPVWDVFGKNLERLDAFDGPKVQQEKKRSRR